MLDLITTKGLLTLDINNLTYLKEFIHYGIKNIVCITFDQNNFINLNSQIKRSKLNIKVLNYFYDKTPNSIDLKTFLTINKINILDYNNLFLNLSNLSLNLIEKNHNYLNSFSAIRLKIKQQNKSILSKKREYFTNTLNKYNLKHVYEKELTNGMYQFTFARNPTVTMSYLGKLSRFANQVFDYAFLYFYAKKFDLNIETPKWIGQEIFDIKDSKITKNFPRCQNYKLGNIDTDIFIYNMDIVGGIFESSKPYYKYKREFIKLFSPSDKLKKLVDIALRKLNEKGKTIVSLHLRRGDFGFQNFFIPPNKWYLDFLSKIWDSLDKPVLYIASDEIDKVKLDFEKYKPICEEDIFVELPSFQYYLDFYILSKSDVLAISNSSFSFLASMLNNKAKTFYRPSLTENKLINYDPWNANIYLKDKTNNKSFYNNKVNLSSSYDKEVTRYDYDYTRIKLNINNYIPIFTLNLISHKTKFLNLLKSNKNSNKKIIILCNSKLKKDKSLEIDFVKNIIKKYGLEFTILDYIEYENNLLKKLEYLKKNFLILTILNFGI